MSEHVVPDTMCFPSKAPQKKSICPAVHKQSFWLQDGQHATSNHMVKGMAELMRGPASGMGIMRVVRCVGTVLGACCTEAMT